MSRALVVTDDARHSFRASLPPHVRKSAGAASQPARWRVTAQDVKEFLIAYCACFMAASAFIA